MRSFPFRSPQAPDRPERRAVSRCRESDATFLVVLGLFWLVSAVRALGAFVRHEVFGPEATLALMAALAVPWIVWGRSSCRQDREQTRPGR